jgi:hypothetical protein
MWITKDERKLLTIYYLAVNESPKKINSGPTEVKEYSIKELIAVFQSKDFKTKAKELLKSDYYKPVEVPSDEADKTSGTPQQKNDSGFVNEFAQFVEAMITINAVNDMLARRELIRLQQNNTIIKIGLNIQGYDLGRKYSNWWTNTGLWFQEYKEHWIWLIVSFLAGILGGVLVTWLSSMCKQG